MTVAASYVNATEIKASMPDVFSGTTHDTLLTVLAARASRLVDALLGHEEGAFDAPATGTARYYNGLGGTEAYIDPCVEISAVEVKTSETAASYTAWASGDYDKAAGGPSDPVWNAGYYTLVQVAPGLSKVFTKGRKTVKVTARWGRTDDPPDTIKQACIIQAGRWFKRGQQAFADTGANSDLGQLMYTKKLDPDLEALLIHSGLARGRL